MPYRMLCSDVQREGVKPSPDLASGLFRLYYYMKYTKFCMVSQFHSRRSNKFIVLSIMREITLKFDKIDKIVRVSTSNPIKFVLLFTCEQ